MDAAELKSLIESGNQKIAELHEAVAEAKGADAVQAEKIQRIEAAVAAQIKAEQDARAELQRRLEEAETKLARRTPGGGAAEPSDETKTFFGWVRGRKTDAEMKAMTSDSDPDGGFMIVPQMAAGIQARLRRSSPVRAVANVVTLNSNRYELLVERGDAGAGWVGENGSRVETATPTVDKIAIDLHEIYAMPKATQRLLDDAAFDVGAWLEGYIADKMGRVEAAAFVAGDGVNKPRGFTTYTTAAAADEARASGLIEHVATGTSGGFDASNPTDKIVDLIHALQAPYRAAAVFMGKSATLATMAKFKDADGRPLLQPSVNAPSGAVREVLGYPIFAAEDMPAIAANSISLAFGDFAAGYTIVERPGLRILRDPFSAKPNILFYATKRVGGGVTDYDAIKLLKFATS